MFVCVCVLCCNVLLGTETKNRKQQRRIPSKYIYNIMTAMDVLCMFVERMREKQAVISLTVLSSGKHSMGKLRL